MRRILYNMEFKGRAEQQTGGQMVWITRSFAPQARFTTEIGADGVDARIEELAGPKAEFNSKVTTHDGGALGPGKKFREWGTVSFGHDNVLKFDTVGAGEFGPVGDEGLMQGGIVWLVDGGGGLFEKAKGIITSNFAFDAAGDVVDYHTGVIYLP